MFIATEMKKGSGRAKETGDSIWSKHGPGDTEVRLSRYIVSFMASKGIAKGHDETDMRGRVTSRGQEPSGSICRSTRPFHDRVVSLECKGKGGRMGLRTWLPRLSHRPVGPLYGLSIFTWFRGTAKWKG